MKKNLVLVIISIFLGLIFFQNCSQNAFLAKSYSSSLESSSEHPDNGDSNETSEVSDASTTNGSDPNLNHLSSVKTYYVAVNGNDANPGTLKMPFKTIKKGISVLKPNEITYVRAGTYTEFINTNSFNFPSGTSWSNTVNLAVYPGDRGKVILKGGFNFGKEPDSYIVIDGLIIESGPYGDAFAISQGSHHIRIQNCEIRNSQQAIVIFWGNNNGLSSDYNEILNNHIHHIGSSESYGYDGKLPFGYGRAHGMYISTSNNIIRGNRIHDVGEYGIHQYTTGKNIFGKLKFSNNNLIERNIVYNNGKNTSRYGAVCCGGITINSGSGTIVSRNVIYNHFKSGISVGGSGKNIKIYHNTVVDYKTQAYAIYAATEATGEIKNNITYPRPKLVGSGFMQSSNLTVNPLFVNATSFDFHLTQASPARDAGTKVGVPAVPDGKPDIGAYEF